MAKKVRKPRREAACQSKKAKPADKKPAEKRTYPGTTEIADAIPGLDPRDVGFLAKRYEGCPLVTPGRRPGLARPL